MIAKAHVEDAERLVGVTREKVGSTKKLIAEADNQVAIALWRVRSKSRLHRLDRFRLNWQMAKCLL